MKTPLIVELVGPAGAGKSTLSKALQQRSPKVHLDVFPDVRDVKNIPFFAWNILLLLPTFLVHYLRQKDFSLFRHEIAYLAILKGWPRRLKRSADDGVVVLDQGPVYMLAELRRFGLQNLASPGIYKWWDVTCAEWAACLDIIVCLDTSDEVLIGRIRSREKEHGIKENPDQWALEFLSRYRVSEAKVLSVLEDSTKSPKCVRFDTSRMSLDETADNILALF